MSETGSHSQQLLSQRWPGGHGDTHGLGAALAADRAFADIVFLILAARVAPAEDGGGDAGGASLWALLLREAADHLLHGAVHVLVLVGVDDGVHDGVEQRQQQEPPFHVLHATLRAVQAVQQQDDEARGPAHDEGPCRERRGSRAAYLDFFSPGLQAAASRDL